MAHFCCRDCKKEADFTYVGKYECPSCGSNAVQIALTIEEMEDDHPVIVVIKKLAETDEED